MALKLSSRRVEQGGEVNDYGLRLVGQSPHQVGSAQWVSIPDVDIQIVHVKYLTFGGDVDDILELYAPANGEDFDETIDSANRIIDQLISAGEMVDNALRTATLTGLNGNIVQAGQPIIALCTEDNSAAMQAYIQISYVLADDVRTF